MEKFTVAGFVTSHRYKTDKGEISMIYPSWGSMDMYEIWMDIVRIYEWVFLRTKYRILWEY